MNMRPFGRLTRRLASGQSRRTFLRGVLGGGAAAAVAAASSNALAQEATPDATPVVQEEWLLVVNFSDAEIVAGDDDPTRMSVTLSGVDSETLAFTDRPQRGFTLLKPEDIVTIINDAADDPVNASLIARMPLSDESDQIVMVLHSATHDADGETMTLEVEALAAVTSGTPVALEPGQTTRLRGGNLFIDGVPIGATDYTCAPEGVPCLYQPPYDACCDGLCCPDWLEPYAAVAVCTVLPGQGGLTGDPCTEPKDCCSACCTRDFVCGYDCDD